MQTGNPGEHERGQGTVGLSFRGRGSYPARRAQLSMQNHLLTIALCYRGRTLLLLSPALLAYEVVTIAFAASRGFLGEWWRGWVWLVANRQEVARQRRALQARRRVADRELLMAAPLPLTDGLVDSVWLRRAVDLFDNALNAYWRLVRRLT